MSDFYREAIAIALGSADDPRVPNKHPASLEDAAEILDALTPRERCDAVYADWLIQLHNPGGNSHIQVRDLLLGQGAMDAHYLAELAQNADDAGASSFEVHLEGNWLWVANNGEAINSLNLLGLCRFFVHSNGQSVELTADTIGKFGIGFKASHRIAEEVLICSWSRDEASKIGFRIPICYSKEPQSKPDHEVLKRLERRWRKLFHFEDKFRPQDQLGHCTPEFVAQPEARLPPKLRDRSQAFSREHPHGTWFALRLHDAGLRDASERLRDTESKVHEVSPLFLRNVREAKLQDISMQLIEGREIGDTSESLGATRTTCKLIDSDGRSKSERFIVMSPTAEGSIWKLAIPINSDDKLYVPDPSSILSSNGRLHAFLPLSGLVWPHLCHLHIDLPPNLARSGWNHDQDQDQELERTIDDVASSLSRWLTDNTQLWHPNWQPAMLLRAANEAGVPTAVARRFIQDFKDRLHDADLVKSIWGTLVSTQDALELALEPGPHVTKAWFDLASSLSSDGAELTPIVPTIDGMDVLELDRLSTIKADKLFERIAELLGDSKFEVWKCYTWSAIGCIPEPTNRLNRVKFLERALERLPIRRLDGTEVCFSDLAATEGKGRLENSWHELFAAIAAWLPTSSASKLSEMHLFKVPLRSLFKELGIPSEEPTTWPELHRALLNDPSTVSAEIWNKSFPPCPAQFKKDIVRQLPVAESSDSSGRILLSEAYHGVRPPKPLDVILGKVDDWSLVRRKLDEWDLRDEHIKQLTASISSDLPDAIIRMVDEMKSPSDLNSTFVNRDVFCPELRDVTNKVACQTLRHKWSKEFSSLKGRSVIVGVIPGKEFLLRCPSFGELPFGINERLVENFLIPNQIHDHFGFKFVTEASLTSDEKDRIGKLLLDEHPHWESNVSDSCNLEELEPFFGNATGNWSVRLRSSVVRRLSELVDLPKPESPAAVTDLVEVILSGHDPSFTGTERLPHSLSSFPSIRAAATSIGKFRLPQYEEEDFEDIFAAPAGLEQNPWFTRLNELLPEARMVSSPNVASLDWVRGTTHVTVKRPAFGFVESERGMVIIVFGKGDREPEEDGGVYEKILYHYSSLAPEDRQVKKRLLEKKNLATFYRKHRDKIVARLRDVHATEMGYGAEHVLRELLQNAESAYATGSCTRERSSPNRSFEVTLNALKNGRAFSVNVVHKGRSFNELMFNGRKIEDIERICSLESDVPEIPGWKGRFNKGFKSLFQVTEAVRITSGRYEFEIRDLLLLDPTDPVADESIEPTSRPTTFQFEISVKDQRTFLLEEGSRPSKCLAFTPHSVAFLGNIDRIRLDRDKYKLLEIAIEREDSEEFDGWTRTRIKADVSGKSEEVWYLLRSASMSMGLCGVAVQIGATGLPENVPTKDRRLYRTFPLEHPSDFAPFLIEGDFKTDHGRRGLSDFEDNAKLIIFAIREVIGLVKNELIKTQGNPRMWCSWVNWIDLENLQGAGQAFPAIAVELRSVLRGFETWLMEHVPDGNALRPISEVTMASPLLYRLAKDEEAVAALHLDCGSWLEPLVAEVIRPLSKRSAHRVLRLPDHLDSLTTDVNTRHELLQALRKIDVKSDSWNVFEKTEFAAARSRLLPTDDRKAAQLLLDHLDIDIPNEPDLDDEDVLEAIKSNGELLLEEYTLRGWLGQLVFPGLHDRADAAIVSLLREVSTDRSRAAWYRLLCLGCAMGARVKPVAIKRFWNGTLNKYKFWEATIPTCGHDGAHLDQFFNDRIHETFTSMNASGEDADLLRRVFYDFRKMNAFVFQDDFPEVILEILDSETSDVDLIKFLRSGHLPTQRPWAGVVGQSMAAPLFFLVREWRRIGLITDTRYDGSCYFMNGRARRAAFRLGWISAEECRQYETESLSVISEKVHRQMQSLEAPPGWFDLPLQFLA